MIGKLFNNRYEIIEKLGSGGTAIVYKGQDTLLGRMVTIKILREEYANDEEFVHRFRREAQAVASLSHGNIVSVYDVGYEENMHYIVMEFVEGESLKDYIKHEGILELGDSVNIMFQILQGIGYAHEHGIIHRDIKPHNILISKDGRVKVTDFGIAVGMSDVTQTYSSSSHIMGSVHYISPEQVQGYTVTEKSDIYSVGVVFYEMLTGKMPFNGDTPISIAMQHVQGEVVPPHQINPEISIGLSYVVMRAMRKNPDARYNSAKEMEDAIRSVTEGLNSIFIDLDSDEETLDDEKSNTMDLSKVLKSSSGLGLFRPSKNTHNADKNKNGKKKPKQGKIFLAAGVILLAALIFLGIQAVRLLSPGAEVEVPSVIGMQVDDALANLEELKLQPVLSYANDNKVEADYVISQDPVKIKVREGREIDLLVSLGAKEVTVPSVVGRTLREAELLLSNNKLKYSSEEYYSDTVGTGLVISQVPEANDTIAENGTVILRVSKGKEPQVVTMPNVTKISLEKARSTLSALGIDISSVTYTASTLYNENIVIYQSIAEGSEVLQGTSVELTISEGPGPTQKSTNIAYPVPNDGVSHIVRVVVNDDNGEREAYNQRFQPGETATFEVTYYNKGKITIYLDGEAVYAQNVY